MRKVYQTRLNHPDGNCLQACIATILGIDLDKVPDKSIQERLDDYARRLAGRGIWLASSTNYPPLKGRHIKVLVSPPLDEKGDRCGHAVVVSQGKVVHDPHPDSPSSTLPWENEYYIVVRKKP